MGTGWFLLSATPSAGDCQSRGILAADNNRAVIRAWFRRPAAGRVSMSEVGIVALLGRTGVTATRDRRGQCRGLVIGGLAFGHRRFGSPASSRHWRSWRSAPSGSASSTALPCSSARCSSRAWGLRRPCPRSTSWCLRKSPNSAATGGVRAGLTVRRTGGRGRAVRPWPVWRPPRTARQTGRRVGGAGGGRGDQPDRRSVERFTAARSVRRSGHDLTGTRTCVRPPPILRLRLRLAGPVRCRGFVSFPSGRQTPCVLRRSPTSAAIHRSG